MYVCIYLYMCIILYVYINVCLYVYMYMYFSVCLNLKFALNRPCIYIYLYISLQFKLKHFILYGRSSFCGSCDLDLFCTGLPAVQIG